MKLVCLLLIISMLVGCAFTKRHPVLVGVVGGAAVGVTVGLLTRGHGHCPSVYDGHPYSGTPPCPQEGYPEPSVRK